MDTPKLFLALKAFVRYQGKILILRESSKYGDGTNTNKYDVPGGRIQPGEIWSEALTREVREETGLEVTLSRPFAIGEWRPTVRGETWQVVATFIIANAKDSDIGLSSDHDDYQWIDPKQFRDYQLIENLIPVFESYNALTT